MVSIITSSPHNSFLHVYTYTTMSDHMCTQPLFQIERVEQIKAAMVSILIIITTIFYHNNYIYSRKLCYE